MYGLSQIRETFLKFFEKNGHKIVPSAPLVPYDDPTLLFVNAGMVPFKNRFTGLEKGDYLRAVSSQKCVRAGGKHNDLDNVGYTARHHTFFEMLGNFSFGDYFKDDAIAFAWELVTKEFSLPKDRLLVTVYHTDDEAANIWKKVAGFSDSQIIRINTNDNFWSMGDTGPCGPCSEIFFDHGDKIAGGPPGSADEDGDRFIEIWNLVFMQYEQRSDGSRVNLPAPSIDTGMGLERVAALLQGKHDNYETDLMRALIEASADLSHTKADGDYGFSHRILADHLRSASFLMADGVLPSSEGRGYVLRRIMRRAMRHAHIIGTKDAFMYKLVPALIEQMGDAYPELKRAEVVLTQNFKLEEESFRKTLTRGLDLLDDATKNLQDGGSLSGDVAFKLYDTYGFPLDLTEDILKSRAINVDKNGFDTAMNIQRQKAKAAGLGSGAGAGLTDSDEIWFEFKNDKIQSEFVGYETEIVKAKILGIVKDGAKVQKMTSGDVAEILFDKTPFYAQGGGQIGDKGSIDGDKAVILDTQKKAGEYHISVVRLNNGELSVGSEVTIVVDTNKRNKIRANHSATHLLHGVLREVLGEGVSQKGSQVTDEGLRFDFSHAESLSDEQVSLIENRVNHLIRGNHKVQTEVLTPDEATKRGALALFGEKYGDNVRVLFMGHPELDNREAYSIELCGGTHVNSLGDIGLFVITSQGGVSSGVRRIEALTGQDALDYLNNQRKILTEVSSILKAQTQDVVSKVTTLQNDYKKSTREIAELKQKLALAGTGNSGIQAGEKIGEVTLLVQELEGISPKELAPLMDSHKQNLSKGVIVLFAINEGKIAVATGVTADLTDKFHAAELVKQITPILGGKGGGGRPDFAQAGGQDVSKISDAISFVKDFISAA